METTLENLGDLPLIPDPETCPIEETSAVDIDVDFDFNDLAKRTCKRLRNFIRQRIWNPEEVEDILQASYLEALRCRDKFRGGSAPETWLFGIAMNLVRSHVRKSLQRQKHYSGNELLEEKIAGTCEDPCDIVMRQIALRQIGLAFDALPSDMQKTLFLVVEQGASYQEAADELGIPIGTVRSRLSRARQLLKECVEQPHAAITGPSLSLYSAAAFRYRLHSADLFSSSADRFSAAQKESTRLGATNLPPRPFA